MTLAELLALSKKSPAAQAKAQAKPQTPKAQTPKSERPELFWARVDGRTKLYYCSPGEKERNEWFTGASFEIMDKGTWGRDWNDGYYNSTNFVMGDRWVGVVFWSTDNPRNAYSFSSEDEAKRGMEKFAFTLLEDPSLASVEDDRRAFLKVYKAENKKRWRRERYEQEPHDPY